MGPRDKHSGGHATPVSPANLPLPPNTGLGRCGKDFGGNDATGSTAIQLFPQTEKDSALRVLPYTGRDAAKGPDSVISGPKELGAALADPKRKQEALVEINRSLLDSYYTFKPGAPLKEYIKTKLKEMEDHYTLAEVSFIFVFGRNRDRDCYTVYSIGISTGTTEQNVLKQKDCQH